jgi:uncharacterized protein
MRIVPAESGWWVLGRRVAHVPAAAVDEHGRLAPDVERHLVDHGFAEPRVPDTYFLTVLTATACNLGCAYCFQNTGPAPEGTARPPRIARQVLDLDGIQATMRFTEAAMAAAGLEDLDILLFGGEPLLNAKGALALLAAARERGLCSASMVTNGTLLKAQLAQALEACGLTRVQVTFDGDAASHDGLRITRAGKPTFDRILANLGDASAATTLKWTARVNIAEPERFDAEQLLGTLAATLDPSRCLVSLNLIDDVGVGFASAAPPWEETAERFIAWYGIAAEHGFVVPMPRDKQECSYCHERRGRLGAVVNADGTLYSCWDSAGKAGWEVGHVDSGYLPDDVIDPRWVSCGYGARGGWPADVRQRFLDRVDGAILDRVLGGAGAATEATAAA